MKKILLTLALAMPCALLTAQTPGGGISDDMLKQIRAEPVSYTHLTLPTTF